MPNRIIKESICKSDTIDSLTAQEEVFFYRLLVNCDDYGRFSADPDLLASYLFPRKRSLKSSSVKKWLNKLVSSGLVTVYEHDGGAYLQVTTWANHQSIRNKKSKYPSPDAPESTVLQSANTCKQLKSRDCKSPRIRNPIQSESEYKSESEIDAGDEVKLIKGRHASSGGDDHGDKDPDDGREEPDKADERMAAAVKEWENCGFGPLSGRAAEYIGHWLDDYGLEWTLEALRRAGDRGKRSIGYVNGILQRWHADGGMDNPKPPPGKQSGGYKPVAGEQYIQQDYTPDQLDSVIRKLE